MKRPYRRALPTAQETVRILARRRTRPVPPPPPVAGRALAKTVGALQERFGQGAEGLKARWREIVGADLARRTEPTRLVKSRAGGGALELRVEGPGAAIVQHQAPDILDRVNLFLGAGTVARLRIIQGPLRGHARRPPAGPATAARRLETPLDAAAEQTLEARLSSLPEGRLKAALGRLGRAVLRAEARG
jgi:hypothetical protein